LECQAKYAIFANLNVKLDLQTYDYGMSGGPAPKNKGGSKET
jgi:hypothetical protein